MANYRLELTEPEVNGILQALAQQPYAQVFELIAKVREQALAQAQAQSKPQEKNDA